MTDIKQEDPVSPDSAIDTSFVNRFYKDSMFRILFKEPEHALSLCNAVHQTDVTDPNDVEIYNLDETVISPYRLLNDLGVLVGQTMLFIWEHQSSSDRLIPWRALEYYVLLVRRKIQMDVSFPQQGLPRPFFYEIYLGSETAEAVQVLEMESLYSPGPETYVNPHVMRYNIINKECPILSACAPLAGYAEFMRKVREARKAKATKLDAVCYAIDYCIEHDLIKNFLEQHRAEITEIMPVQLTMEEFAESIRAESIEKGVAKGESKLQRLINAMKDAGKTLDFIFTETSDSAKLPGLYKQYGITA